MSKSEGKNMYLITYLNNKGQRMSVKKAGTSSEQAVRLFRASTKFRYIVIGVQEV